MNKSDEIRYRTVIAHELKRAKEAFNSFTHCASIRIMVEDNKELAIQCFEHYTDFVAHLYEFYMGCIAIDNRTPSKSTYEQLDEILTKEAERHLSLKRDAIDKGYAPSWENHRSVYEVDVPKEFGKHWRYVRNRRNHASLRRFTGEDINLSDFYEKYHGFIYILFSYPQWVWTIKDTDSYDWGDIEKFDSIVRKSSSH